MTSPTYLSFVFRGSNGNLTIKAPFQLLNFTLEAPLVSNLIPYFPCQPPQAQGNSYSLGRAFLQAASPKRLGRTPTEIRRTSLLPAPPLSGFPATGLIHGEDSGVYSNIEIIYYTETYIELLVWWTYRWHRCGWRLCVVDRNLGWHLAFPTQKRRVVGCCAARNNISR